MRIAHILFLTSILVISGFSQTSLKVGTSAPVFAATALDGTDYDLSELRGKVVVLTFWSTRCEICRGEIPTMNRLTDRFDENRVIFLALTMENESKVGAYLKTNPFKFHILPNSFGVVLQYADRDRQGNIDMGFPSYFVINQSGAIEYRASGWDKAEKLNAAINRLLSNQ